jgi:three-Cys-motif partner protein
MKDETTGMGDKLKIDEIGYWSEVKLAILDEYARPYNQILRANKLKSIYIDGFAGAGHHLAKGSERVIEGSPQRALNVQPLRSPPLCRY